MLTGFAEQLLRRFVEVSAAGKARILRRNRPHQPWQGCIVSRLGRFHPVQQRFGGFCRLAVMGGGVADHQHIRLQMLAIVFQ